MIIEFAKYKGYKVGDYVKIKLIPNYVLVIDVFDEKNLFTKIVETENMGHENDVYRFVTSENKMIMGYIYLIKRKMTQKEIEEYTIREETNNYNL